MTNNRIFPRWQGAIFALFLMSDGLFVPVSPASIRTLAAGSALAALIVWGYFYFLRRLKSPDFFTLCQSKFPSWLCQTIFIIIALLSAGGIWLSLARLSVFWHATAFPGLPTLLLILPLIAVGWAAGRRGKAAVCMWSYPTAFAAGMIILLSIVITLPDWQWSRLPAVARSLSLDWPVLKGFLWLFLPLLLCTQSHDLPAARACMCGVLLGGLSVTLTSLRAFIVLGTGVTVLPYPAYAAAGIFSVGDFLQRGEVIFSCALAVAEAVRVAALFSLIYECKKALEHAC